MGRSLPDLQTKPLFHARGEAPWQGEPHGRAPPAPLGQQPPATPRWDLAARPPPANHGGKTKEKIYKGKLKKEQRNPSAFAPPPPPPDLPPAWPPANAIGHCAATAPGRGLCYIRAAATRGARARARRPPAGEVETPSPHPSGGGGPLGAGRVALFLLLFIFLLLQRAPCRSRRRVREHNPEVSSSLCKPRGTGCPGGDGCTEGTGLGERAAGPGRGSWIVVPLCPR